VPLPRAGAQGPAAANGTTARWIFTSPHDDFTWERVRSESAEIGALVADVSDRLPTIEPLLVDLFGVFYRADVQWRSDAATDEEVAVHRVIIERVLGSPSYHRLHPAVQGELADSIMVIDAFARAFAASMNAELVDFLDAEAAFGQRKRELQAESAVIDELNAARARPKRPAPGSDGHAPEEMTAAERKARLEQIETEMADLEKRHYTDYDLARARSAIRRFIEEADVSANLDAVDEALDDFAAAMGTWGIERSADEGELGLDERIALFRALMAQPRLRALTDILGRARFQAGGAHRSRAAHAPLQIAGIHLSSDLARLTVPERAYLIEPSLRNDFYRRYAERGLRTYRIETKSKPERGPVIILTDESSSMRGEPDLIAKAIGLAILGIARSDGRVAAFIEFAGFGQVRTTHFRAGLSSIAGVIDIASHFFGGATDFDGPINTALALVAEDERYGTADIIIVTDGEARLHRDTIEALRKARASETARLFAVCVGHDDRTFRDVAVQTWPAVDLLDQTTQGALVSGLVDAIHS
jgi:uncharacterized protein with von Willebrand factor type A (vWA) domain